MGLPMLSSAIVSCLRRLPLSQARKISRHLRISHDVNIDGMHFRCSTHNSVIERELLLGTRGPGDIELKAVLNALPRGGTFVDIGANIGLLSLFGARKVGPNGRVVAIESSPPVVERLRFNIARNGISNIYVVMAAAGAERGLVQLYGPATKSGQSSLSALGHFALVDVPIVPLAEIVADCRLNQIDVIKIDIEGLEDRALLPFLQSAPRSLWPRRIVMETYWLRGWREACLDVLLQTGYILTEADEAEAVFDLA